MSNQMLVDALKRQCASVKSDGTACRRQALKGVPFCICHRGQKIGSPKLGAN